MLLAAAAMVFALLLVATFVYRYPQRRAGIERKAQAREQIWSKQVGATPAQVRSPTAWLDVLWMAGATVAGLALVAGLAFLALRRSPSAPKAAPLPVGTSSPERRDPPLE
jgi:hypothetical protein